MPKSSKAKLEYQRGYNARPEEKERRRDLGRTRYQLEKEGKVHVGDGKDVSHKVATSNGGSASRSNVKVEDRSSNRDWRKNQKGYKVPNEK